MMWSMIVGFVMPNIVALLQQPRFSSTVRALVTAVASIVGGFGTAYFNDQFNFEDIVGAILITGVASITFYKGFWKPTGVAVAIENATSKTPPSVLQRHPDDGPRDEFGAVDTRAIAITALVIAVVVLLILLL